MLVSNINLINMKARQKNSMINAKSTGIVAATGIGLAALASLSKNKTIHKSHKTLAIIALVAMLIHIFKVTNHK